VLALGIDRMCDSCAYGVYKRCHAVDLFPRLPLIELDVARRIFANHRVARVPSKDRVLVVPDLAGHDELVQRLGGI
jgi:hypothetical protein